jgi:hypothetical protein
VVILYIHCDISKIHYVYTLFSGGQIEVVNTIRSFVRLIKRRWGFEVRILYTDNDPALIGNFFNTFLQEIGITYETLAPNIHNQNGLAERYGAVLTNKATALINLGGIPQKLWPEAYAAAGYILNRTPTRSLE